MADRWARSAGRVAHYFRDGHALCNYKLRPQSDDARPPRCRICSGWIEKRQRPRSRSRYDTPETAAAHAELARTVRDAFRTTAFGRKPRGAS